MGTNTYSSNSSKPLGTAKTAYEGIGSSTYNPSNYSKEESNLSKVTGMATNIVKGISSKMKGANNGLLETPDHGYRNYTSDIFPSKEE